MIVSAVGVLVQLKDRNDCRLDVSVISRSSNTIAPGLASTPSTRTRICSLAFPEDTRFAVELEVTVVVVILVTWETLMNKSSSAAVPGSTLTLVRRPSWCMIMAWQQSRHR